MLQRVHEGKIVREYLKGIENVRTAMEVAFHCRIVTEIFFDNNVA